MELAAELAGRVRPGERVVELGCGLGVASLGAARAGARALATDISAEALTVVERSATANGLEIETLRVDWREPDALVARGPFDLVVAADVLYERAHVAPLLRLMPRLAPEALLADPGRPAADAFLERWPASETRRRGVISIHRLT